MVMAQDQELFNGVRVYEMLGSGFMGLEGRRGIGGNVPGETDEVPAISVIDLLDHLLGDYSLDCSYSEKMAAIKDWCNAYNAVYYGAPRDEFSLADAYEAAMRDGYDAVVIEDLS